MEWWGWIIVGFVCLAGEILTPGGFYLLFFGIAGVIVGLLDLTLLPDQPWIDWLLFSTMAIGATVLLRPKLMTLTEPPESRDDRDSLVGQSITLEQSLAPDEVGQAELRGSPWRIKNVGMRPIISGQRCVVRSVNGLMLEVTPE